MIMLDYYDPEEYVPAEDGRYLLFMRDGQVVTGRWIAQSGCFFYIQPIFRMVAETDVAYWSQIPSLNALKFNLHKEM